ncbi:hypothetical protein [Alcanivorax sp. 1008]|uniref:hypothetical protein n=1 Tax=Alcanivorax sp. 1008 TaxID=2816853 RepID=UPI001D3DD3F1|nr:hypothetical protein [Alcanivorax sp. 1008]MCC1497087.1 hypothetical protein [Alcanivorax sp. 1008]
MNQRDKKQALLEGLSPDTMLVFFGLFEIETEGDSIKINGKVLSIIERIFETLSLKGAINEKPHLVDAVHSSLGATAATQFGDLIDKYERYIWALAVARSSDDYGSTSAKSTISDEELCRFLQNSIFGNEVARKLFAQY